MSSVPTNVTDTQVMKRSNDEEENKAKRMKESVEEEQVDQAKREVVQKLRALLDEVSTETQQAKRCVINKEEEIREYYFDLRTKVDTQSEVMHEEIRRWSENMRDQISEREKQSLDQFNAEVFEESAARLNSLLSDINDYQKRVSEQIEDANSDAEKLNTLIKETSEQLNVLKRERLTVRRQKFGMNIMNLIVKKDEKIDPSRCVILDEDSDTLSQGIMIHFNCQKDQPRFEKLLHCFINPFAESNELIAVIWDTSYKIKLVKMDSSGKILKEKETNLENQWIRVKTAKKYFLLDETEFDYDLNQVGKLGHTPDYDYYGYKDFALNKDIVISTFMKHEYRGGGGPEQIRFSEHDSEEFDHYAPSNCEVLDIKNMLASEKYLFICYDDRVRVAEFTSKLDAELSSDVIFDHDFSEVKLAGDKYIATFDDKSSTVRLFTQDNRVELIGEFKINLDDKAGEYSMSGDCSSGFCFFNFKGDIYHNLF